MEHRVRVKVDSDHVQFWRKVLCLTALFGRAAHGSAVEVTGRRRLCVPEMLIARQVTWQAMVAFL